MATRCVKTRMKKDGMSKGAAIKACYPNADSKERKKISRGMTIQKVVKGAISAAGAAAVMKSRKRKKY